MSVLQEPFVLPYGRDFAPRKERRFKYGYSAIDEISLSALLENGLKRELSIYTTHTIVDHNTILNDKFYLRNSFFGIEIPFQLQAVADRPQLHALTLPDFYRIPQKLWHMFRYSLFAGNAPEDPSPTWKAYYGSNQLRMLRLDFELVINPEAFDRLSAAFNRYKNNTIPLHLSHHWQYQTTKQSTTGGVQYVEEDTAVMVENVWKDFIIVRRQPEPESIKIGIASDFHYSDKNDEIKQAFPDSVDINAKIGLFSQKVFNLWRDGKLDYMVLNGDIIDYLSASYLNMNSFQFPPTYEESNWDGFKRRVKLYAQEPQGCLTVIFPWLRQNGRLMHVPVIWNTGDHDRLISPYPLAAKQGRPESHYNLWALNSGEGLIFPTAHEIGAKTSHVVSTRWVYEHGRMAGWPLRMLLTVGGKNYHIYLLDTRHAHGNFDYDAVPLSPLNSTGLSSDTTGVLTSPDNKDDFTIIITHCPPVCLSPSDARFDSDQASFDLTEGDYGTFVDGRPQFFEYLADNDESDNPVLVISGHVHFRSFYAYKNSILTTGNTIENDIGQLNALSYTLMPPEVIAKHIRNFWKKISCLLMTTPSIGPKPQREGQSSQLLILDLSPHGISKIIWNDLEV